MVDFLKKSLAHLLDLCLPIVIQLFVLLGLLCQLLESRQVTVLHGEEAREQSQQMSFVQACQPRQLQDGLDGVGVLLANHTRLSCISRLCDFGARLIIDYLVGEVQSSGLNGRRISVLHADDDFALAAVLLVDLHLLIADDECLARPVPLEAGAETAHLEAQAIF